VVEQLIAARCNVDLQTKDGDTPLFVAAIKGASSVTRLLIAARCNMNLRTEDGFAPIHFAAIMGHTAIAQQLITAGCDVDLQSNNGTAPIHSAAGDGQVAVTSQLIAARCNVDLQTTEGATPLLIAAHEGHAAVTSLLLAGLCPIYYCSVPILLHYSRLRSPLQRAAASILSPATGTRRCTRQRNKGMWWSRSSSLQPDVVWISRPTLAALRSKSLRPTGTPASPR